MGPESKEDLEMLKEIKEKILTDDDEKTKTDPESSSGEDTKKPIQGVSMMQYE